MFFHVQFIFPWTLNSHPCKHCCDCPLRTDHWESIHTCIDTMNRCLCRSSRNCSHSNTLCGTAWFKHTNLSQSYMWGHLTMFAKYLHGPLNRSLLLWTLTLLETWEFEFRFETRSPNMCNSYVPEYVTKTWMITGRIKFCSRVGWTEKSDGPTDGID